MARSKFLIHYADRTKATVDRATRDDLLLRGQLEQIGPKAYRCKLELRRFDSFAGLEELRARLTPMQLRRFLAGLFWWQLLELKRLEKLESAEGMAERMSHAPTGQQCKFNLAYAIADFERRERERGRYKQRELHPDTIDRRRFTLA